MDFTLEADCRLNANRPTKSIDRQHHRQQQQQHQTRRQPHNNHENIPIVNTKFATDGGTLSSCACDHNNNNNNNNNNSNNGDNTSVTEASWSDSGFVGSDDALVNVVMPGITLSSPDGSSQYRFEDYYTVVQKIAKGSFGTVFVAEHKGTREEYAVKVIERKKLSEREKNNVMREVSILQECRDMDHIVRLMDFFVSPRYFFVVQVYAQGGDVFARLAGCTSYTEKEARGLAKTLLQAMQVLHERKIVHRDLKPENLLLQDIFDNTKILIADFGFARHVPPEGLSTRCGTPAFVAPEVLVSSCHYDERIDMWSVGCLLYMLLGGYPPFREKTHKALSRKIRGADFCFHDASWKNVSTSAKTLIAHLLVVDPQYRCTARLALEKSHWFQMSDRTLRQNNLSASLGEIKLFDARRHLMGAVHAVKLAKQMKRFSVHVAPTANMMGDPNNNNNGFEHHLHHHPDGMKKIVMATNKSDNTMICTGAAGVGADDKDHLQFTDSYVLGELIHTTQTGVMYECRNKFTGGVYAVRIIDRTEDTGKPANGRSLSEAVLHEAAILSSLNHKYVVKFIEFFEEEDAFYLVTERMYGGDLFDRMIRQTKYTERDARFLARALLEAVAYLHEQRIAHRDLKPQNIMLQSDDDQVPDIKIADFGFACRVHTPQSLTTRCGTPTYVAPEILKNIPYDQSVDMWSVGVILYILICGYPPFMDDDQNVLFQKIRLGEWQFHEKHWQHISNDAKTLIRKLLVSNPRQRWTAKQCLESPWFNTTCTDPQQQLCGGDAAAAGGGSIENNNKNADLSASVQTVKDRASQPRGSISNQEECLWKNHRTEAAQTPDVQNNLQAVEMLLSRREVVEDNMEGDEEEEENPEEEDTPNPSQQQKSNMKNTNNNNKTHVECVRFTI